MSIGPYTFIPKEDYVERYRQLPHTADSSEGPEGLVRACYGTHVATGSVLLPKEEKPPALKWRGNATELQE